MLTYRCKREISVEDNFIEKLTSQLGEISISSKKIINKEEKVTTFHCRDQIGNGKYSFNLSISFEYEKSNAIINYLEMEVIGKEDDTGLNENISEKDLAIYIQDIILSILLSSASKAGKKYYIRTYSRYYQNQPICGIYTINGDHKIQINFVPSNPDIEPSSERIVLFDIEINAYSLDHARSIAYKSASEVQSCLSFLLDTEFEFFNTEVRHIVYDNEEGIQNARAKTGYIDEDLNLLVYDNLNGLQHLEDSEESMWGNINISLYKDFFDNDSLNIMNSRKKVNLEDLFLNRKFQKVSTKNSYSDDISETITYPNQQILVPKDIRRYFKSIYTIDEVTRHKFISCCRMYNLALKLYRLGEPTACLSYFVGAIETLTKAKDNNISYSEFLKKYANSKYNKELCDYLYNVRSAHFHAGEVKFLEDKPSLLIDTDFIFVERQKDFFSFYELIRLAIKNWIKENILM